MYFAWKDDYLSITTPFPPAVLHPKAETTPAFNKRRRELGDWVATTSMYDGSGISGERINISGFGGLGELE